MERKCKFKRKEVNKRNGEERVGSKRKGERKLTKKKREEETKDWEES